MDYQEIESRIIGVIKVVCFKRVDVDQPLVSSKFLDSIVSVDLAVELENEFSIKIPFIDINEQNFETVRTISKYIEFKINPK
jgi:D-alanine--poly(phosphoribitol) ligase subunit 2